MYIVCIKRMYEEKEQSDDIILHWYCDVILARWPGGFHTGHIIQWSDFNCNLNILRINSVNILRSNLNLLCICLVLCMMASALYWIHHCIWGITPPRVATFGGTQTSRVLLEGTVLTSQHLVSGTLAQHMKINQILMKLNIIKLNVKRHC